MSSLHISYDSLPSLPPKILYIINSAWTDSDHEISGSEKIHNVEVEDLLKLLDFKTSKWSSDEKTPVSFWQIDANKREFRRYSDVPKEFVPGSANCSVIRSDVWILNQTKKGKLFIHNQMNTITEFLYAPGEDEMKHIEEMENAFKSHNLKGNITSKFVISLKTISPAYWVLDFPAKDYRIIGANEYNMSNHIIIPTEESKAFLRRTRGRIHSSNFGI